MEGGRREFAAAEGGTRAGWAFLLVVAMYQSTAWTEVDMAIAFYRTLVVCETPAVREDGTCPKGTLLRSLAGDLGGGSSLRGASCAPIAPGEVGWSGSAQCGDQSEVVKQSVGLAGEITMVNILGAVCANSVLGTLFIDAWGRKPMILLSMGGLLVLTVVFSAASGLGHSLDSVTTALLLFAAGACALPNTFAAASSAMAVDGTKPDSDERNTALVRVNIAKIGGTLAGFALGFFILLLNLTDYTVVWLVFSVVVVVFIVVAMGILDETKPPAKKGEEISKTLSDVRRELSVAFELVFGDPFLRAVVILTALSTAVAVGAQSLSGSWAFMVCGYSQAVASLTGVVQPSFMILGSVVAKYMMQHFGPRATVFVSLVFTPLGHLVTGFGGVFAQQSRPLYWSGYGLLVSLGYGFFAPAAAAIVSSRVDDRHQGKLFATATMVTGLLTACGVLLFTTVLLHGGGKDATAGQMTRGWFIASAAEVVLLLCWAGVFWRFGSDEAGASRTESEDDTSLATSTDSE